MARKPKTQYQRQRENVIKRTKRAGLDIDFPTLTELKDQGFSDWQLDIFADKLYDLRGDLLTEKFINRAIKSFYDETYENENRQRQQSYDNYDDNYSSDSRDYPDIDAEPLPLQEIKISAEERGTYDPNKSEWVKREKLMEWGDWYEIDLETGDIIIPDKEAYDFRINNDIFDIPDSELRKIIDDIEAGHEDNYIDLNLLDQIEAELTKMSQKSQYFIVTGKRSGYYISAQQDSDNMIEYWRNIRDHAEYNNTIIKLFRYIDQNMTELQEEINNYLIAYEDEPYRTSLLRISVLINPFYYPDESYIKGLGRTIDNYESYNTWRQDQD